MKRLLYLAFATAAACCCSPKPANGSNSPEARADALLDKLTLEQKASLMMNDSPAIDSLGIHEYNWWSEALHGTARNGLATVFPQSIAMASSWDEALLQQVFDIAGNEQRIKFNQWRRDGGPSIYHGLSVWTPNINIFRDPRWGRGQETYGEDPYLTSRMGKAVVDGLQGMTVDGYDRLHACLKHFAVHSGPEHNRHSFNVEDLSMRDLQETYLYAFERLVKTTNVHEVMCAYQRLDSKPCCGNDQLLMYYLREKWGYKGIVVSDCGAIDDFWVEGRHETFLNNPTSAVANAVRTGTDVECGNSYRHLVDAVREGKISEEEIDKSLRRLLIDRFRMGEMDWGKGIVPWDKIDENLLACDASQKLAVRMACESMVLLQNDGLLPLPADGKYFVTGPNAADSICLLGNYNGTPEHAVSALEGITKRVGTLAARSEEADVIIYVGGINPRIEGEEMHGVVLEGFYKGDRTSIELPRAQREEVASLAALGKPVVFVNMSGSAIALEPESKICGAILQAWYAGEAAGEAIGSVLFGEVNPSGKLPVTFYRNDSQLPGFEDYNMAGRTYRYFSGEPLWHFGHGLSYTSYEYGEANLDKKGISIPVTNSGSRDGDEIVQLYVRRDGDRGPAMSLRGFKRVSIPAGKTVEVRMDFDSETFRSFDPEAEEMTARPGSFTLFYGPSANPATLKSVQLTRK